MGLINMKVWNRAAIAKLCWDLANKEYKLWIKWIHILYKRAKRMAEEETSKLDDTKSHECTTKCGASPADTKEE